MANQLELLMSFESESTPASLSFCNLDGISKAELRYLNGPLIVFGPGGGWGYPSWLKTAVQPARMSLILSGDDDLASEEETLGYLCSASLAVPLDHEWADIFFWLGERVLLRWNRLPKGEPLWKAIGRRSHVAISSNQQQHLDRLRRWLRCQVEKNGKRVKKSNGGRQ